MLGISAYQRAPNAQRIEALDGRADSRRFRAPLARGLSIVILNLDRPDLIVPQLRRLARSKAAFTAAGYDLQILVGDTGSTNPATLAAYDELAGEIEVTRGLRYHFSRNNNEVAFARARHDVALFLNNDVILPELGEPFLEMRRELDAHPEFAVAGACLWFPGGEIQHAGIAFVPAGPRQGLPFHRLAGERVAERRLQPWAEIPAVTGACLMIRSELFARIGGFDEAYAREAQDIDLCLCARRLGAKTALLNAGPLVHLENATRPKGDADEADRALFLRRWSAYVEAFAL